MIEHIQVIPDKCRACRRCEVACIAAHHGMTFKEAMKHRDVLVSRVQVVKAEGFKTTVRCHQCSPAPCCNICPTGALQTRMPYQLGYYKASLRPIMGKDCITWKCRDIDGNEYTYKYVNRIRH